MKNIAALFPGQGSQFVGMGKDIFNESALVATMFEKASEVLGQDMQRLCFEGPASELVKTENTQPALLLCSVASFELFIQRTGLKPIVLAGHSLGELSALVAAKSISLEDGLTLAKGRGMAMAGCSAAGKCGMTAIKNISLESAEEICRSIAGYGSKLVVANNNSPAQFVLSGCVDALAEAADRLKEQGAVAIPLRVSTAFHSPYMEPAQREFEALLRDIEVVTPSIPVIANVDAQLHSTGTDIKEKLVRQVVSPVQWLTIMEKLNTGVGLNEELSYENVDLIVEAGPGEVLSRLAQGNIKGSHSFSLDVPEQRSDLFSFLETDIRTLKEKPSILGKCLAVAVSTRNTNWDETSYAENVVTPYQMLKELFEDSQEAHEGLGDNTIAEGLGLLQKILDGKGVPNMEQKRRLNELRYFM